MNCALCKTPVAEGKIGFRDECPRCGGDLHICRNCLFYEQQAARQCREPAIPETVRDKERRNLCEYFQPAAPGAVEQGESASAAARRKLEALFK
ncbi:MAG: hypothetical protein HGA96_05125 [Desulfobulbaceae bacterium]|nr:hypothetical protein [Desulfobulbaceae bacterium]